MPAAIRVLRTLLLTGVLGTFPVSHGLAQGDGSRSNNVDLLRGSFSPYCEPAMLCHYGNVPPPTVPVEPPTSAVPPSVAAPPKIDLIVPDGPVATSIHGPDHVSPILHAARKSAWRASYGLSLRGAFVHSGGSNRYEAVLTPNLALRYDGQSTAASVTGRATIVQPIEDESRLGAASLEAGWARALGPSTRLKLDGAVSVSQDDPNGLDIRAAGVMTGPLEFRAAGNAEVSQQFGRFNLTTGVSLSRTQSGETRLLNGGVIDNSGSDRTGYGANIRLGYKLTPIFGVFVSGDGSRDEFDRLSADIGASRSGWTYALRGGINANWHDLTTVEASIGSGWRVYDSAALPEAQSLLYGFAIGYSPDPTLRLRATLDSAIEPGTNGAISTVDHSLSLEVAYRVNQWLGLRATGSGSLSESQGTGALTRRYGAGLGADIAIGTHTDMTLDYGYAWRENPATAPQVLTEHRVSAGITLQY